MNLSKDVTFNIKILTESLLQEQKVSTPYILDQKLDER